MSVGIKILAVIYVLILAGIIVLANVRETQYLFLPLRRLPFGDKIGHFLLMGFLSLMANLAFNARTIRILGLPILWGSLLVLVIVVIEEFSQIFVRGRTFDLGDLLADFLGIVIFGEMARLILKRRVKSAGN